MLANIGGCYGGKLAPLTPSGKMNPLKGAFQEFNVLYHIFYNYMDGAKISPFLI